MEQLPAAAPAAGFSAGGANSLSALLLSGRTVGGLLGDASDAEEALYAVGHAMYQQAKYDKAQNAFAYLLVKNHLRPRNYIAFGACLHAQGQHAQALRYYALASVLDPADPDPVLLLAECQIAMGERAAARQSVDHAAALAAAREDEEFRRNAARARRLAALLDAPLD